MVRKTTVLCATAAATLAGLAAAPASIIGTDLSHELHRSATAALPLAALLMLLAGLAGTRPASRMLNAAGVLICALPAMAVAWSMLPQAAAPVCPPAMGYALAAGAAALAFALLIAERALANTDTTALADAPALQALAFVATAATFAAAVLEATAQLGVPLLRHIGDIMGAGLGLLVGAIAAELSLRALGRCFLPPPAPAPGLATSAAYSAVARAVSAGARARGGLGAPLRQHFGIDLSRSWALAYMRSAALPMLALLALLGWGLTGVTMVPVDGRAVYERFGAPVAVLHSGLNLGLPWPLGATRAIEFGTVHAIGLNPAVFAAGMAIGPEDPAPAAADRLWEQPHPAEITLLIASQANGRQSFQSINADMRILYRVGLDDAAALRAPYALAAPEDFVRATAGRVAAAYFAAHTLYAVLGANREAMAATMRSRLQLALDQSGTGLEAVAVVIEAVHPPSGAAEAYHNVRAAEIAARASVAVEHGAAATIYAQSRQYAFDQISNAKANAADIVGTAKTAQLRFTADRDAARAGGESFLLERYFTAISNALGRAPKTIIDHRLNWPEAPVLDLRPFAAATGPGSVSATGKEE